ncbi:MAG: hypothetical protein GX327_06800 [Epulopiscium sp.]|nr:hypothetical protein [Candidatus Epulonipiscium sp.]
MKKKFLLYLLILICTILMVSCQRSQEKTNKDSDKEHNSSDAFEEIESISEELLLSISKKEWDTSAEQVKSLHSKWNSFFSEAYKKGISAEKAEEFNNDLNELTNLIISKAMEENKKKADLELKKDTLKLEQQLQKSSSQEQNTSSSQEKSSSKEEKKEELTLPEENLPDNYPLLTASPSELKIAHAAVKITKHLPYMSDLFKLKVPSEVLTLKYLIRDIKISSKLGLWDLVNNDLKEIEEIWPRLQGEIVEKKEPLSIQFNQILIELKDVINQKDSTLTTIKSDIALENIKSMTDLFK